MLFGYKQICGCIYIRIKNLTVFIFLPYLEYNVFSTKFAVSIIVIVVGA
jgi:hypothetical protein